jgi:hypothetical protein
LALEQNDLIKDRPEATIAGGIIMPVFSVPLVADISHVFWRDKKSEL